MPPCSSTKPSATELPALLSGSRLSTARDDTAAWLNSYITAGTRHIVIHLAADDHHAALEGLAKHVLPLLHM